MTLLHSLGGAVRGKTESRDRTRPVHASEGDVESERLPHMYLPEHSVTGNVGETLESNSAPQARATSREAIDKLAAIVD